MQKIALVFLGCFSLQVLTAQAADTQKTPPRPSIPCWTSKDLPTHPPTTEYTLKDVNWQHFPNYTYKDLNFSGYIDGSYNYLKRSNLFTSGVPNRLFDIEENGFTLHQLAGTVSILPDDGFGGLINVIAGSDANITPAYGLRSVIDSQNFGLDFLQAFFYAASNSWKLIGGRYVTLAGYESFFPPSDTNFSRSIIAGFAQPGTFLGFRGTYSANDKLDLVIGLNNGWDNVRDTSRRKTVEYGFLYKATPKFNVNLIAYNGGERATPRTDTGPIGVRNVWDLVATYDLTDRLSLAMNADYDIQSKAAVANGDIERATWYGIAGYFNYQFTERWRTSIRGEYFNDPEGFATGVRQAWKEGTLTLAYAPFKHLELRAETRHDFSNKDSFLNKNNVTTSNNQQSYALEALLTT